MLFAFIISQLIFSVNLSLVRNLGNELVPIMKLIVSRKLHEAEGVTQDMNQTIESTKLVTCIKESELEEFILCKQKFDVKNTIDQFETHWGIHFEPNSAALNGFRSPVDLDYEIRRLKWKYILDNFGDSSLIKGLNSELQKAGINRTMFCEDIAVTYMRLTHFEGDSLNDANLMQTKSVQVFLNYVSSSKSKCDENDKQVQIPESLYNELIRNNANAAVLKRHHEDKIALLKKQHKDDVALLKQNYENNITMVKQNHENKVEFVKQRYQEKISNLKRIFRKRIEECKEQCDFGKRLDIREDIRSYEY